jgi:excisionase family DNA binding protein
MNRLLTMDEASEYLGISKLTLYGWVSARKLGFVKVGRLVKFKQHDLDKWIDRHTVKARVQTQDRPLRLRIDQEADNGTDETAR